jgi:hypothetical protein
MLRILLRHAKQASPRIMLCGVRVVFNSLGDVLGLSCQRSSDSGTAARKTRYGSCLIGKTGHVGSSRPSAPSHFTSGSARICGSSAEKESDSRKDPHCECGNERRAQHPQEIVEPGRLDARRAIELIDFVRVDQLHRIRCSVRGVDARGRRRASSTLGNWRNWPSRSRGRKQTSAPAFVIERLLIRTRRGDRSRSGF